MLNASTLNVFSAAFMAPPRSRPASTAPAVRIACVTKSARCCFRTSELHAFPQAACSRACNMHVASRAVWCQHNRALQVHSTLHAAPLRHGPRGDPHVRTGQCLVLARQLLHALPRILQCSCECAASGAALLSLCVRSFGRATPSSQPDEKSMVEDAFLSPEHGPGASGQHLQSLLVAAIRFCTLSYAICSLHLS